MLECRGLAVAYGRHQALQGVDLRVAAGEIVVILGANGAGKTTLLKAIAGLVPAAAGSQVRLDGVSISGQPPHRIVEAGLALVPEGRGVFADLSVRENLLLGAFAQRARAQQAVQLERVHGLFPRLAERSAQQVRTMSGGEQQMVAIGRALMSAPAILMLDEPSLGLSPLLCAGLFKALAAVRATGVGILLVEQNAKQSLAIADRAILLENGHVVGEGPADELARDPAVQAAYLGGAASKTTVVPRPASMPTASAASAAAKDGLAAAAARGRAVPASAGNAGARSAPTEVRASLAGKHIGALLPPEAEARSRPADALIPLRIADLVQRATRVQADDLATQRGAGSAHGARSSAQGSAAAASIAGSAASAATAGMASNAAGSSFGSGSLAEAIAGIEAAAAAARRPPPAAAPVVAQPRSAAPLPTIEVWRRPPVEVWRRDSEGHLRREGD